MRRALHKALGHTVNLANRLQKIASPGQILITQQTYDQVKAAVKVEALAPMLVRSITEPLQLYNVVSLA